MAAANDTDEALIFLGACLIVRDPDGQLERRDSISMDAMHRAISTAQIMLRLVREEMQK